MELRDRKGLTESEFLKQYTPSNHPRPSVTADLVIFAREGARLRVLLIRRGGHPFLGCWALPGGFTNPNETVEQAAERELLEETHLRGLPLAPIGLFSSPGRDPRTWVISAAYAAVIEGAPPAAQADDDAADVRWFDAEYERGSGTLRLTLRHGETVLCAALRIAADRTPFGVQYRLTPDAPNGLAFDHAAIIGEALLRLLDAPKAQA